MTSDGKDMAIGLSAMLLGVLTAAAAGWMLAGAFGMAGLSVACVAAFLRWPEPFGKALAVARFVVGGPAWLAGKIASGDKDMAIGLSVMLLGLLAAAAAGWMLAGAFGMAGLSVACVAAVLRWPEPFGKALAVAGFVVCGLAVGVVLLAVGVGWLAGKMVWVVLAVILFAISPVAGGLFIVGRALVEFADGAERAANRRGAGDCAGCRVHFEIRNLTVYHVTPQSKGGGDHLDNLQWLCGACNSMKGT